MGISYKEGVPIDVPHDKIIRARKIAENVYRRYFCQDLTVTSTKDGKHMKGSKHYKVPREGEDWRFPDQFRNFMWVLQKELGKEFDLMIEKDHLHVEVN